MNWVVLPFLFPLAVATISLALPVGMPRRIAALTASVVLTVVSLTFLGMSLEIGPIAGGMSDWSAKLGIVLIIDAFSAIMLSLTAVTLLACTIYGMCEQYTEDDHPLRWPLLFFLTAGVNLSFITGDLFNLFVAFEIMLIASYGLLSLETSDQDVRHAFPYVAMNLVGSALFLVGSGFTYGLFGTLNMAELSVRMAPYSGDVRLVILALLFLTVFGLKAGLFPLYYWLPRSYPTLPAPIAAFYSGILTKVGVYVLLRVFGTIFPPEMHSVHTIIAWMAGFTMLFGVMGALAQGTIRSVLSYHILSQIGFMVLAIGLATPLAAAAAILYITHHIIVKSTLFLGGGVVRRICGTDDLKKTGGVFKRAPWLASAFLLQALSLSGIPPLSGFWGKLFIVKEGFAAGAWILVGISLVASVFTVLSMLKIWNGAFWPPAKTDLQPMDRREWGMTAVICGMTVISLGIGFGVGGVFEMASIAAEQVMNPEMYRAAVFAVIGKDGGVTP